MEEDPKHREITKGPEMETKGSGGERRNRIGRV
jgi:hypothetical protein